MDVLTDAVVLAQQAGPSSGSDATLLLGIAAILAALVPVALAAINRRNGAAPSPPDATGPEHRPVEPPGCAACPTRARLERDAVVCNAEARIAAMEIGNLQARLADCRHDLEEERRRHADH